MSIKDTLKDVYETAGTLDLQKRIVELEHEILDVQRENVELRKENATLKAQLDLSQAVTFDNGAYWLTKADRKDGPFYKVCYEQDGRLSRVYKKHGQYTGGAAVFICNVCNRSTLCDGPW
jgi:hypothetical protein